MGIANFALVLFLYFIFYVQVRIEYTEFSHPFMLPLSYILSYFCCYNNYFFIMFLRFNNPFVHTIPLAWIFGSQMRSSCELTSGRTVQLMNAGNALAFVGIHDQLLIEICFVLNVFIAISESICM